MLFLQIVGGLVVFIIVFVLLGIPLGYTEARCDKEEE